MAQGKSGRGLAGVPALSLMFTGASVVPIKVCCNLKVDMKNHYLLCSHSKDPICSSTKTMLSGTVRVMSWV